ncbi:acyltransferase family protein [Sphingomonas bacterium]|uniref:acyltransferase family protein n=1 Tax=Sphingomonas bacterium TaxID=1895847 RepID=UPI001577614C|nr:acyltransferase [Sphingomonas bacterium]
MADTVEAFRRRKHFDGLNGLRALAILAVIWHHCYTGRVVALGRGFLGVDLFFVLSGFLIMTLLLRERAATGRLSLPRFWVRRALRLFPPYYLLLAITAGAALLHPAGTAARGFFTTLPTDLVYLSNWVPSRGSGSESCGRWRPSSNFT